MEADSYGVAVEAPGLVDQDALEELVDPRELLLAAARLVSLLTCTGLGWIGGACRRRAGGRVRRGAALRGTILAVLTVDAAVAAVVAAVSLD